MSTLLRTILLVFEELLYFLFPLSEDERLIKDLSPLQYDSKLHVTKINDVISLACFSDPEVRAVLHLVKYHRHQQAVQLAGSLLETYLRAHTTAPVTLIPVPLSNRRLRERGYNQTELIVREAINNLTDHTIDVTTLRRHKHTVPQTKLQRQERINNVQDAFSVRHDTSLAGKHVVIVDDVLTTGATLKSARASLAVLKPASVTCVAIAH